MTVVVLLFIPVSLTQVTLDHLKAPGGNRLRRPIDQRHVSALVQSYKNGDSGGGRVMILNIDFASLDASIRPTIQKLCKNQMSKLIQHGAIFETINGNHRREMGKILQTQSVDLYKSLSFEAKVYQNLPTALAWKLASKANMDSSEVLVNTFFQNVVATREVSVTHFKPKTKLPLNDC